MIKQENLTNLQKDSLINYLIINFNKFPSNIKEDLLKLIKDSFENSLERIEIKLGVNYYLEIYNMYDVYLAYIEFKNEYKIQKDYINFENQDELNNIKKYIEINFSNDDDNLKYVTDSERTISNFAYMIKKYIEELYPNIEELFNNKEFFSLGNGVSFVVGG